MYIYTNIVHIIYKNKYDSPWMRIYLNIRKKYKILLAIYNIMYYIILAGLFRVRDSIKNIHYVISSLISLKRGFNNVLYKTRIVINYNIL